MFDPISIVSTFHESKPTQYTLLITKLTGYKKNKNPVDKNIW